MKEEIMKSLHHEEIAKCSDKITKTKPFINKYGWQGINSLSEKKVI